MQANVRRKRDTDYSKRIESLLVFSGGLITRWDAAVLGRGIGTPAVNPVEAWDVDKKYRNNICLQSLQCGVSNVVCR